MIPYDTLRYPITVWLVSLMTSNTSIMLFTSSFSANSSHYYGFHPIPSHLLPSIVALSLVFLLSVSVSACSHFQALQYIEAHITLRCCLCYCQIHQLSRLLAGVPHLQKLHSAPLSSSRNLRSSAPKFFHLILHTK